jgi:hypothetical protein
MVEKIYKQVKEEGMDIFVPPKPEVEDEPIKEPSPVKEPEPVVEEVKETDPKKIRKALKLRVKENMLKIRD